jgi:hypothetical protein
LLFGQLRRTPSSKGPPHRFARQAAVRVQFATAVLVTTNFLVGRCTASAMASASRRSVEGCYRAVELGEDDAMALTDAGWALVFVVCDLERVPP